MLLTIFFLIQQYSLITVSSTHIAFSVYLTACYGNDILGNMRFKIGIDFDIHIVL